VQVPLRLAVGVVSDRPGVHVVLGSSMKSRRGRQRRRRPRRQHRQQLLQRRERLVLLERDRQARQALQVGGEGRVVVRVVPAPARAAAVVALEHPHHTRHVVFGSTPRGTSSSSTAWSFSLVVPPPLLVEPHRVLHAVVKVRRLGQLFQRFQKLPRIFVRSCFDARRRRRLILRVAERSPRSAAASSSCPPSPPNPSCPPSSRCRFAPASSCSAACAAAIIFSCARRSSASFSRRSFASFLS